MLNGIKYGIVLLALVATLSAQSCKEPEGQTSSCLGEYPIDIFLERYANDLIIPDYESFLAELKSLGIATQNFTAQVSQGNLDEIRVRFESAYLSWQDVEMYNFGPAEDLFLADHLNHFPLNLGALRTRLDQKNNNFESPDTYDKGFPAFDYLLFGLDTSDQALLDSFNTNPAYAAYLNAMMDFMETKSESVLNQWKNSYKNEFTSNTGVAAGQPFSTVVNSLNQHFEKIRRNRIGIPSGALTLNFPQPDEVEAPYSGLSLALAKRSLNASKRYFEGGDGEGLDNALEFLQAQKAGRPLHEVILTDYENAAESLNAIPETLSESAVNNTQKLLDTYQILSPMVVHLKSDLPSVMCIAITYVDNPSDSD